MSETAGARTETQALADPNQAARLARALLTRVVRTFRAHAAAAEPKVLAGIDAFVARPGAATYLGASRLLHRAVRDRLLDRVGGASMQRSFAEGIAALRETPGLPAALVERLEADLPRDARAGQRLIALAALARSYDALLGRVLADTEQMRQRVLAGRRPVVRPRRGPKRGRPRK